MEPVNAKRMAHYSCDLACFVSGVDTDIHAYLIFRSLVGSASHRVFRPIDGESLELQSHAKAPVGKPLTVHDASECPEITHD